MFYLFYVKDGLIVHNELGITSNITILFFIANLVRMLVNTVAQELTEVVLQALDRAGLQGILEDYEQVQPTKNPKFGDFQSNHAFRIGRIKKCNPREIATQVKDAFPDHEAIREIDVAGPGFLNLHLDDKWLIKRLQMQVEDPHCGIPQEGKGRTAVIDYSSPNVAKRMHIGHMRSTIIGNAIDHLYRSMGWNVVADNHIGDWGTQFGKLIVSWNESLDSENFAADPIAELERLYVLFAETKTEEREALARKETAKLQSGDPENRKLWKQFITASLKEFDAVYDRLGVEFNETLGESAYNDDLKRVVTELKKFKIAVDSEGAVVISFAEDCQPKSISNSTLVIQKKDGAFLYGTTDLATLEYRQSRWKPEEIVYVTDARQQLHFQQVFKAWGNWRVARADSNLQSPSLKHVYFGMLKLTEGVMSTRKGNVIRLVELLDEAVRRAKMVTDEKSNNLMEEERSSIAEAVGISAIRYFDLSQNPQSDVKFSWDRMLALDGNSAPFLMYSYARARGIQRKGEVVEPTVDALENIDQVERKLVVLLLQFPITVTLAQRNAKANVLCDYLYEVASLFNRFYFANPVLTASDEQVKQSRLALVESTLRVLKKGMDILGIVTLERM